MNDLSMILGAMGAGLEAIIGSPLVQTIAGGLIGAVAATKAVDRQISADRDAEGKSDEAAIARLKLGLRVEMEAILKMAEQSLGPAIAEWKAAGGRGGFGSVFPFKAITSHCLQRMRTNWAWLMSVRRLSLSRDTLTSRVRWTVFSTTTVFLRSSNRLGLSWGRRRIALG